MTGRSRPQLHRTTRLSRVCYSTSEIELPIRKAAEHTAAHIAWLAHGCLMDALSLSLPHRHTAHGTHGARKLHTVTCNSNDAHSLGKYTGATRTCVVAWMDARHTARIRCVCALSILRGLSARRGRRRAWSAHALDAARGEGRSPRSTDDDPVAPITRGASPCTTPQSAQSGRRGRRWGRGRR